MLTVFRLQNINNVHFAHCFFFPICFPGPVCGSLHTYQETTPLPTNSNRGQNLVPYIAGFLPGTFPYSYGLYCVSGK